jgi:hypothetical protein
MSDTDTEQQHGHGKHRHQNAPGHEAHTESSAPAGDAPKTQVDGSKSADTRLGELKAAYDKANVDLKATIAEKQAKNVEKKANPEDADIKAAYDALKVKHTEALATIRKTRAEYQEYRDGVLGKKPAGEAAAA